MPPERKGKERSLRYPALHAQLHLQNSTGRSPICILALFRPCTDRMAQVTHKNSTGRSPIFILALFRSCTDRAAQVTPKNSTGRSPFFCLAFVGPFSFPNSLFSSQLHPFRTLKVQWGRMSSAAGGLAQEVLRTHCRLLDFNPKNSTGPKPKC